MQANIHFYILEFNVIGADYFEAWWIEPPLGNTTEG